MKRLLTIVLLAAACAGGSKKPDTANTASSSTSAATLELGELKLIDLSKNKAVLVHTSGEIDLPDMPAKLKLSPDGKLVRGDTGEVGMQLMPDGTVTDGKEGKTIDGVTLTTDGTLTANGKTLTIDASGMLAGGNPDAPQMKVEGATTPGLKRTAMFVMLALTAGGTTHQASSTPPAP